MENNRPDYSEMEKIEDRLKDCTKKLHQLVPLIGAAETVVDFSSDQRKNALAAESKRYIQNGESVASADTLARSSPVYLETIKTLETNYTEAQRIRYEWRATMCSYEAARSLLARQRESLKTLEG